MSDTHGVRGDQEPDPRTKSNQSEDICYKQKEESIVSKPRDKVDTMHTSTEITWPPATSRDSPPLRHSNPGSPTSLRRHARSFSRSGSFGNSSSSSFGGGVGSSRGSHTSVRAAPYPFLVGLITRRRKEEEDVIDGLLSDMDNKVNLRTGHVMRTNIQGDKDLTVDEYQSADDLREDYPFSMDFEEEQCESNQVKLQQIVPSEPFIGNNEANSPGSDFH